MKTLITIILVFSLVLLPSVSALAQLPGQVDDLVDNWKRAGQAAMPFLRFGAGARTMAMGDAALCLQGDVSALFYNPAGMAYVEKRSVMLSQMSWIMDTSIMSGAVAISLGNLGTFGVSAMFYDYGDPIKGTVIDGTTEFGYRDTNEFEPSEYVIGVGYARQISASFAIGAQIKLAFQDLLGGGVQTWTAYQDSKGNWVREGKDATNTALAFDFGTIYDTGFRGLTLAMSLRNFGREVMYEQERFDLPISFHLGLCGDVFNLLNMKMENQGLLVNVDYLHPRDWSERVNAGVEYSFNNMFFVRGGYKYNYSLEGLCVGGGVRLDLKMGVVKVDYAYKDTKDTVFDAVNVFSLGIDF